MTTAEPGSAGVAVTTPDSDGLPEFATVMRGYDRGQVDDYVTRLKDFVADAERRAELAERAAAQATQRVESLTTELRQRANAPAMPYDGLGERIESILRIAAEEAEAMREAARAEIEQMHEQARHQIDEQVQAAERKLEQVRRRRDEVVHELRRVQEALATLGLRPQAAVDEAYPEEPAQQTQATHKG